MVLNFAYSVPWQTPSTLRWHLINPGVSWALKCWACQFLPEPAKVFINNIEMPLAHFMPPFYCFFLFSHLPRSSESPAVVVLVSLPYTSPFLRSTASPAKGMWSLNKEMAGKPSKGMLVSCCWLRWVALRRRHQAECSDAALWPNTWSCSVSAHPQLLLGLGFLWQELFCWKVPITPFLSGELSLSSKGPHPQTIYVSRSNWFLSQLPGYLCISGPECFVCGRGGSL